MVDIAKPFRLLGHSAERQFVDKVTSVIRSHCHGWFENSQKIEFQIIQKNCELQIGHHDWNYLGNSSESWIGYSKSSSRANLVAAYLFSLPSLISVESALIQDIYFDFMNQLVSAIFGLADEVEFREYAEKIEFGIGSGAVIAEITNSQITVPIIIGGGLIERIISSEMKSGNNQSKDSRRLVDRKFALNSSPLHLRVSCGIAEVSVDELFRMEKGDVVRLNTKIGDPLIVYSDDQTRMGTAQLGKSSGHKAVQFIE